MKKILLSLLMAAVVQNSYAMYGNGGAAGGGEAASGGSDSAKESKSSSDENMGAMRALLGADGINVKGENPHYWAELLKQLERDTVARMPIVAAGIDINAKNAKALSHADGIKAEIKRLVAKMINLTARGCNARGGIALQKVLKATQPHCKSVDISTQTEEFDKFEQLAKKLQLVPSRTSAFTKIILATSTPRYPICPIAVRSTFLTQKERRLLQMQLIQKHLDKKSLL